MIANHPLKTLVLVLGCAAPPYPSLVEAIERTWASVPVEDVEVLFYYGGPDFAEADRSVWLPVADDLRNAGRKTIACFEYVLDSRNFDVVFRTNCSTYVDLPNLHEFVRSQANRERYYAGKGVNHDSIDFAGGSGYFLSRDLVRLVVDNQFEWDHDYLDDVALGKLLRDHGVERQYAPRVIVKRPRDVRRAALSEFHFRCKTDSRMRDGDVELMRRIHGRFERARAAGLGTESGAGARDDGAGAGFATATRSAMIATRARAGTAVRRLPGGPSLLRTRRRALGALRARTRPIRPPIDSPERVAALSATPGDDSFITGNGLAARCRYVLNFDVLAVNEHVENDWWFCKADFLEYFFAEVAPRDDYVLFTHNSDRTIGRRFRRELGRKNLVAWFAQNPAVQHRKLRALPIGIANPRWPHGDQQALERVRDRGLEKTRLFDVSFSLDTNPSERGYCLDQTGLAVAPRCAYPEYLERLASAHFCISPRGNGIDGHRTWEALVLRTIPVVTRSLVTEHHADYPMLVLDDWSQFRSIDFTPELYERTWHDWDPAAIRLDGYLERIEATIRALRA